MYMVQANESVIVPVNLKESHSYDNPEKFFVLVKLLDRGGHLHVLDSIMENGIDILPEYVKTLDRSRWVCFYPHFPRIDSYLGSILFSVLNVSYNVSHTHPSGFFDAIAKSTALDYNEKSWIANAELFLLKFATASAEHDEHIVPHVVDFHAKFQSEWLAFIGTERHTMDFTAFAKISIERDRSVIAFIASYMKCALVITKICQNGLGYLAVDCIEPRDLPAEPPFHILVTDGGEMFDSLSAYKGENEDDEADNALALAAVVQDLLVTDRLIWAHNTAPVALSTSTKKPYETPASQFLHIVSCFILY